MKNLILLIVDFGYNFIKVPGSRQIFETIKKSIQLKSMSFNLGFNNIGARSSIDFSCDLRDMINLDTLEFELDGNDL